MLLQLALCGLKLLASTKIKAMFNQSFLYDTLNLEQPVTKNQRNYVNGELTLTDRGILVWKPNQTGPDTPHVVVSAGIHGDETSPLELIDHIVNDIISGQFSPVAHCLFILGHPQATNQHVRYITENLNRLFDEKPRPETIETRIAECLKQHMKNFFHGTTMANRWHLDLHAYIMPSKHYTFAVSPKSDHPVRSKALIELLNAGNIGALLLSKSSSKTFSWYSGKVYGAQAATVELGRINRLKHNDLAKLEPFNQALRALLSGQPLPRPQSSMNIFRVHRNIMKSHADFKFSFTGENTVNFTQFSRGELLATNGEDLLHATDDNEAIVFPNPHVGLGQRAALMVVETRTEYENQQLVLVNELMQV